MRKLLIVLFVSLFPVSLFAGETEVIFETSFVSPHDGESYHQNELFGAYYPNETMGVFGYVYAEPDYKEAYAGPVWRTSITGDETIEYAIGFGREWFDGKSGNRVGAYAYVAGPKEDPGRMLLFVEDGASGFWYEAYILWSLRENLLGGVMSDYDLGHGPRLEYSVEGTPATVWGAVLAGKDEPNLVFGLTLSF